MGSASMDLDRVSPESRLHRAWWRWRISRRAARAHFRQPLVLHVWDTCLTFVNCYLILLMDFNDLGLICKLWVIGL